MKPFDNVIVSATEPEQKSDVWIQHAENIFDKNKANFINGYFNEESTSIATSSVSKCLYLEIEGNKEYCITKKASARFNVGTTSEVPNVGVNLIDNAKNVTTANTQKNASQIILKASVSAKYMIIWYYASNDDTLSENEILDSIIIKENIQDDILVNDNGVYNSVLAIQDYTLNQEKKIGKWITGEDLYSMTVQGTSPKVTTDGTYGTTTYIDLSNRNIKQGMLRNSWIIDTGNNVIGLPYLTNSGNVIKSFFNTNLKKVEINCNVKNYSEVPIIAEVIYTKN